MESKVFNSNDNCIQGSSKVIDKGKTCNDHKLTVPNGEFYESYGYDILFDDYQWELHQDPLTSSIQLGPELQGIGIQYMILFEKYLIIETEDGIIILTLNKQGSHSLYRPLKHPRRDHARALMQTTNSLLNAKEFKYSIRERMNGT